MPVVQCPQCKSEYDPGNKELDNLPAGTSIKVVCPACGQWLRLPERDLIPAPAIAPEFLQAMMKQSLLIKKGTGCPAGASEPAKKPWWKFWQRTSPGAIQVPKAINSNEGVESIVRREVAARLRVNPQSLDMKQAIADGVDVIHIVMSLEERFVLEIPESVIVKHVGVELGNLACKPSPMQLVAIVSESQELAARKK